MLIPLDGRGRNGGGSIDPFSLDSPGLAAYPIAGPAGRQQQTCDAFVWRRGDDVTRL